VNEEDTVTVGQDLVKLELGGAPGPKEETATEKPKEPADVKQPPAESNKPQPSEAPKAPSPPPEQPPTSKPQRPAPKSETPSDVKPSFEGREERRVRLQFPSTSVLSLLHLLTRGSSVTSWG
jgi:2-oxoglutarate dehydrogenase E2 component (dihydrolipoamide succinyltransferase)